MRTAMALAAGLLLLAGCGKDGPVVTPPVPGDLLVTYSRTGPAAGAFLLSVNGGPVTSVALVSSSGIQMSFATTSATSTKVLLAGTLIPGDLLRVSVPDLNHAADYLVRVDQAADPVTFALVDPAAHSFSIHR